MADEMGAFNMDYHDMVKAKYTSRKRGADGKWKYEYAKPAKPRRNSMSAPEEDPNYVPTSPELAEAVHTQTKNIGWEDLPARTRQTILDHARQQPDQAQSFQDMTVQLYWLEPSAAQPLTSEELAGVLQSGTQKPKPKPKPAAAPAPAPATPAPTTKRHALSKPVQDAIRATGTYLRDESPDPDDPDNTERQHLAYATRQNGDVGEERASPRDYKEAIRVRDALRSEFGDKIEVHVEDVDEWINLDVYFKSERVMSNINPLDVLKGNIHMSELPGLVKAEGDQEVESTEDEDDDTEEEEEEVAKSDVNPLDVLKSEGSIPRVMRQGSVTYVNADAYEVRPEQSRRSLQAPAQAAAEQHERNDANPLNLIRTRDGTLTHPTGVRRVDDGRS